MLAGNPEITDLLLKHGADVNIKDIYGWTALTWAEELGRIGIVNLLRSNSVNVKPQPVAKPKPVTAPVQKSVPSVKPKPAPDPVQKPATVVKPTPVPAPKPPAMSDAQFLKLCESGDVRNRWAYVNAKSDYGRTALIE